MKKTEEKFAQPAREKTEKNNPNPGKPQQPHWEHSQENGKVPKPGTKKQTRPAEWQTTIPTEHQNKSQRPQADFDDPEELSEEEESTV